jgi:hypothetical protein
VWEQSTRCQENADVAQVARHALRYAWELDYHRNELRLPVGETGGTSTAWWICPIETAAKSYRVEICERAPRRSKGRARYALGYRKVLVRGWTISAVHTSICQLDM